MVKRAVPGDYDVQPERFRANRRLVERFGLAGDVHEPVAERLVGERLAPTLDVGCGEGRLGWLLAPRSHAVVSLDSSAALLRQARPPKVLGDARTLPLRDGAFGSVAALYCLYHVEAGRRSERGVPRVA